jgi:protein SCO1/2
MGSSAKYWVLLIGLLAAGYGSLVAWRAIGAGDPPVPVVRPRATQAALPDDGQVAPFQLTDQDGKPFDSSTLEGKVWVASFFFTNCPAVCWRMNQALSAWQQTHPDSDVRFVSITCDPHNDTPEALKRYAEHFKADPARWTFLTGDMAKIKAIGQDSFKISVVEGDHTDRACVVDRQGQIRGRFRLTEPDQVEMLDRLLDVVAAEPAPEPSTGTTAPATEAATKEVPTTEAATKDEPNTNEAPAAPPDGEGPPSSS